MLVYDEYFMLEILLSSEWDVQGLASASRRMLGALNVYAVHLVQHVTAYEVKA